MTENNSKLLNRIGELLTEVQEFKKDIINQEKEVKKDIQVNSEFLSIQKDLLVRMKSEVTEHNMEYRTNLEEITKYIENTIMEDLDNHINKKVEDINKMIEPLVSRVVKFQDSVNEFEKTLYLSTDRLYDLVEESSKAYKNHVKEMDRFSKELSDKKEMENTIITTKEMILDIVNSLVGEKLDSIIRAIGYPVVK